MSSDGTITVEAKVDSSSFSKELNNLKNLADTALKSVTTTGEDVQKKWGTAAKTLAEDLGKLVSSFQKLNTVDTSGTSNGLSILESAIYAASTATQVATLAQLAFNSAISANPIGIAAGALAGFAVLIGNLTSCRNEEAFALQRETAAAKERLAILTEEVQAKEEEQAAREKSVELELAQINRTEILVGKLFGLIDANGKVKKGYEDWATELSTLINSVMPGAIEAIETETGLYISQTDALYDLIAAKKAESMLSSNQGAYQEALVSRDDLLTNAAQTKMQLETENQRLSELYQSLREAEEALKKLEEEGIATGVWNTPLKQKLEGDISVFKSRITDEIEPAVETLEETYKQQIALVADANAQITHYEELMVAAASGDAERINAALSNYQLFSEGFKTVANASAEELKLQAENYIQLQKTAQELFEKGVISEEWFSEITGMANQAIKEAESAGVALDQGVTEGIKENQVDVEKAFSEAMISVVNAGKAAIDSHSPSQVTKEQIGLPMAQGIVEGITEGGPLISQALSAILQNAMGPTEGAEGEESMVMENPFQSFFLNMASWLQNQGTAILINWQALLLLFRDSGIYQTSQMVGGMQEQLDRLPEMADSAGSRMMDSLSQAVEGRREQLIAQVRQMMNEVNAAMGGSGGGYGGPGVSPAAGRASSGGNPPVINNNFYTPTASSLSVYNATKDAMARTLYFE